MLEEIGTVDNIPSFLEKVRKKEAKLMGFGHRVYKNYDSRAAVLKVSAHKVLEECGKTPLLDAPLKLEEPALKDDYFKERHLFPNVDFYSGLILKAIGFPESIFTVLFAVLWGCLPNGQKCLRTEIIKLAALGNFTLDTTSVPMYL